MHRAGAALRRVPAARRLRGPGGTASAHAGARALRGLQSLGPRPRLAALAAGEGVPRDVAADRLQPALQGLVRDGLIRQVAGGYALG